MCLCMSVSVFKHLRRGVEDGLKKVCIWCVYVYICVCAHALLLSFILTPPLFCARMLSLFPSVSLSLFL